MHMHTHALTHALTHTNTHTFTHTHTHGSVLFADCSDTSGNVFYLDQVAFMYVTHTCTCTHMLSHMHSHTQTHTHSHIHTHTDQCYLLIVVIRRVMCFTLTRWPSCMLHMHIHTLT